MKWIRHSCGIDPTSNLIAVMFKGGPIIVAQKDGDIYRDSVTKKNVMEYGTSEIECYLNLPQIVLKMSEGEEIMGKPCTYEEFLKMVKDKKSEDDG